VSIRLPNTTFQDTTSGRATWGRAVVDALRGLAGQQVTCRAYTVATLPSAETAGQVIYVSNEAGGAVIAFADGTNWRRVTDRAIVS
jgi:hypothetical protein